MNKGQIIISTHTPPLKTDDQTVDSDHLSRDFQAEIANAQRLGYQQTLKTDTAWNGENGMGKVMIVAIKEGR